MKHKITRLVLLIGLALVSTAAIFADEFPRVEVFGGYSYLHVGSPANLHAPKGWGASVTANITDHVGVTADFGGHYKSSPFGRSSLNFHEFLFGPRVNMRVDKMNLFAHALFGATSLNGISKPFTMGLGGGVDAQLNKNLSVRLIQVDYLPMYENLSVNKHWLHSARLKTGVVFTF